MLELLSGLAKKELKIEVTKLFSNDSINTFLGGSAITISGDGNVVIANTYNDPNTGVVCVFVREEEGWVQKASLLASDRAAGDFFGSSASISHNGDVIVIGARDDDDKGTSSGSAYVFVKNGSTWSEQAKLTASDGTANDWFGQSVSISEDGQTAIVGANRKNNYVGSFYVFIKSGSTWTQQAKLVASDGAASDNFGISVSTTWDGNTVVVGSLRSNELKGSVYVFTRSGSVWTQQAKLIASDGVASDNFGYSVSISEEGSVIFIGANNYKENGISVGAVYLFEKVEETWEFKIKFTSGIPNGNQGFGVSVSTNANGSKTIIGAFNTNNRLGAAYILDKISEGNYEIKQLLPDPNAIPSNLGYLDYGYKSAISSNGKRVIVCAYRESTPVINNAGALYFYDLD